MPITRKGAKKKRKWRTLSRPERLLSRFIFREQKAKQATKKYKLVRFGGLEDLPFPEEVKQQIRVDMERMRAEFEARNQTKH